MKFPITIKTFYGLEPQLREEVEQIGASDIATATRAVTCSGDMETLYRANYELHTAVKVLTPIKTVPVNNQQDLYREASSIDWAHYFSYKESFAIEAKVNTRLFNHSGFVALKVKDAIADQFRKRFGKRPDVDKQNPRMLINVHVRDKQLTISLDSSGAPLFKRGYKKILGEAPLNEVLAAGMIMKTGWQGGQSIYDFMCGSGTLLTEAALIAHNLPANYYRTDFAFRNWRNYDAKLWYKITETARKNKANPPVGFYGSDIDIRAVKAARKNVEPFYFKEKFIWANKDFVEVRPQTTSGVVVVNPPYGRRIKQDDINRFYKHLGNHLKQNFAGFDAWILSSNQEAIKHIGLRSKHRETLYNGGMEAKFLKFPLKSGKFA